MMKNTYIYLLSFFMLGFITPELMAEEIPEENPPRTRYFTFQAGAWSPVGKLSSIMGTSPYLGMRAGIPLHSKKEFFIDVGVECMFPRKRQSFEYDDDMSVLAPIEAKADFIYEIGIWLRHVTYLGKDTYWNKYAGAGYHVLSTDQTYTTSGEYYNEDSGYYTLYGEDHYMADILSFTAGISFTYKGLGSFFEFKYTPYNQSGYIKENIGSVSFLTGITYQL